MMSMDDKPKPIKIRKRSSKKKKIIKKIRKRKDPLVKKANRSNKVLDFNLIPIILI